MQAVVEHRGKLLRRAIAGKIGTPDVSHKQSVAGEYSFRAGRRGEVCHHDADALDGVTGSLQKIKPAIAEVNGVAVFNRCVRECRPGALARDRCALRCARASS